MAAILTVLTVSARETTEADALVGVQLGAAVAGVVAGLLRTRMVLEHGYVAGAQGVLLSEDGSTHQNDLGAESTGVSVEASEAFFTIASVMISSGCRLGLG